MARLALLKNSLGGCRLREKLLLGLVAAAVFSSPAWTQGQATISGSVTDASGAIVVGANVTATESQTGIERTTASDSSGLFVLSALRPTEYSLTVSAPAFRQYSEKGITLLADQSATINVKLEVGSTTETLTVVASGAQVDTATATLRQVVDSSRMVMLPLNGRNAAQLTTLVAGAVTAPNQNADQGSTKSFPAAVTVSTNGSRQNWVSYLMDGVPNVDVLDGINMPFPAPDALQEFSVQTSNYTTEVGESAGGIVNIVTKSGTNSFHGDAFGYLRNAVFNAHNFFAAQRDPLKRAQYGGTIGGPIIHDKLFIFGEYQGTRIRSNQGGLSAYVPTAANEAGDFSSLLSINPNNPQGKVTTIKDPATGQLFPANIIPLSRLNPASAAVMKALPQAGGNGLIHYSQPIIQNYDEVLTRADYSISSNDRLTVRYFWDRYIGAPVYSASEILAYKSGSTTPAMNAVVEELHIFNPGLLSDLHLGFSRENIRRAPATNVPSVTDFGVNITQSSVKGIEGLAASGYFSFGDYTLARFPRQTLSLNDDLRWVFGRHSIAFGGMYERDRFDQDNNYTRNGSFTFSGDSTGSALADLYLGSLRTFTQGGGQFAHNRLALGGVYVQDNFRASSRLALNFGLRWEPSLPWHDLLNKAEVFHPNLYAQGVHSQLYPLAPAGLLFVGDPGVPNDGVRGDWTDFAPRGGFAYDVFGNGKTSVRGGAGIFYESRTNGFANNRFSGVLPFSPQVTLTTPQGPFNNPYQGITDPFLNWSGTPGASTPFQTPVLAYTWDPGNKLVPPTADNWNFTIEQEIPGDFLLRTAYVGMHGSHLNENIQLNPAVYTPGSTLTTDQRRIFQGLGSVQEGSHQVNSRYNSLQISLQKRLSRGFTVLANYTLSHATDNLELSADATSLGANGSLVLPWYYPHSDAYEHGPSDFDRQQVFVTSYVWQLPALARANRWLRTAAGSWEMSGIVSAQTGAPLTIQAGKDQSQTGIGYDRAELVSTQFYGGNGCGSAAPCINYVNPAAFALPAIGTFGNVGKGSLRGPGILDWDMGVHKSFTVTERWSLEFRAEFFNATNRVNLLAPTSSVNSAGFGSIRSASDPRIGQLAMKIIF
jgi:hypothetical protein